MKDLAFAKSRLRGALPGVPHRDLVLALLLDTVAAALAAATIVVVTSDETVAVAVRDLGAKTLPDAPAAGLNEALRYGAAATGPGPVAALLGDLPALRGNDLAAVLRSVTRRGYVRDAAGTGTTLLAAPEGTPLDPMFGVDSARRHAGSGAVELPAARSVRCDVDTAADLAEAAGLGLGAHTAALWS